MFSLFKLNNYNLTAVSIIVFIFINQAKAVEPGLDYSIARGGKLYDKWFKENSVASPKVANPAYPDSGKYKGKKSSDWRCKECHGWDYNGKDGHYRDGKHYTGINGLLQLKGHKQIPLKNILHNSQHNYTQKMLSEQDYKDLDNFLSYGLFDMTKYI